jgi:hypothetical protein
MTFGTLLTLFVVPTAYTLIAGRRRVEAIAPPPARCRRRDTPTDPIVGP